MYGTGEGVQKSYISLKVYLINKKKRTVKQSVIVKKGKDKKQKDLCGVLMHTLKILLLYLQSDFYTRGHLNKESQTTLQAGNKE